METYIYVAGLDYYIEIRNEEFFNLIQETYDHGYKISVLCKFEEDGVFYITYYGELRGVKCEIGYICRFGA